MRTFNKFLPLHPPLAATTSPHHPGRRQPAQRGNPLMSTRTLRTTDGNVADRLSPLRRSNVPQNVNLLFNPNPRWLSRENSRLPMQIPPTALRNSAGSLCPVRGTETQCNVNNLLEQCHFRLPQLSTFWVLWAQALSPRMRIKFCRCSFRAMTPLQLLQETLCLQAGILNRTGA